MADKEMTANKPKKADPQYDNAELKRELTMVQGFDFEIHDEFTLMRIKSRNNGPIALVRMKHMPRSTKELIHVVQATFVAHLHPICTAFTLTMDKARQYTRENAKESYLRAEALAHFKMGFGNSGQEIEFLAKVAEESGDSVLTPIGVEASIAPLEWGSSDGKGNRLRQDVVKKTQNIFKSF